MAIAAPFPGTVQARSSSSTHSRSSRRSRRSGRSSRSRLTARGRAVLLLASTALLLLALLFGGRITAVATDSQTGPATASVVVRPGQSLWQIAKEIAPGTDPRAVVAHIRELNGLGASTVHAGQAITVPLG